MFNNVVRGFNEVYKCLIMWYEDLTRMRSARSPIVGNPDRLQLYLTLTGETARPPTT